MSEKNINFEKNLSELEKIIERLENGECSLEESIELFEKGIKITKDCRSSLENAQKRIVELTQLEEENN